MVDTSVVLGAATVQELRDGVRGEVVVPGDPGYSQARAVWNGMFDRHPAVIVRCAGVADVVTAVRFARSEDLSVAVRGGGHSFAGFGVCDGGIVIDVGPMKGAVVDPRAATVRAQAGLTWAELDHETQAFRLATPGGLVSSTGIAGFTLGGGLGWLTRRHGMAVDNLLGADVITADGELVRADIEHQSDLLWGLRGGGGNFGIVTSLDYRLHPVGPVVIGGAVFHPIGAARQLLEFYRDWVANAPDELATMVAFLTAPPLPFMPAEAVGTPLVAIAACHAGDRDVAAADLATLKRWGTPVADGIGPIPYVTLQRMFDASAPAGMRNYTRTAYADRIDDAMIETLLTRAAALPTLHPLSTVHLHHLGGAVDRVPVGATAFPHRGHPYVFNVISAWADPADDPAQLGWARAVAADLAPEPAGAQYANFLADAGPDRVRAAYGDATYQRLVALKRRYDPTNLFRLNLNVPPDPTTI
jgi:FAD/FMN-containing dehydrogenase